MNPSGNKNNYRLVQSAYEYVISCYEASHSGKSTPREAKITSRNGDPNGSDKGEAEEPVAGELLLTTVPSLLSPVKGGSRLISSPLQLQSSLRTAPTSRSLPRL